MWAVLPVKTLGETTKQRLERVLDPGERQALFRAMVGDVFDALSATKGLTGIAVVTRDDDVAALARRHGARVIIQGRDGGQTAAVKAAADTLASEGVDAMITLPGDVPLVTAGDIEAVMAHHGPGPAITIVPARDEMGSNCIVCSPPNVMDFSFGDNSFVRHLATAHSLGIEPRVVENRRLGLDIDTPADLAVLLEQPELGHTAALRYLANSGIAARVGGGHRPLAHDAALALADNDDLEGLMGSCHGNSAGYGG